MTINANSKYSKEILEAYEKNISKLPLHKAGHFFERAYKITGNKKYEGIIYKHVKKNKIAKLKNDLAKLKKHEFIAKIETPKSNSSERKKKRLTLYKKNPQIKFFNSLLIDLLFCKMFSLQKTVLKEEFLEIINELKNINFRNIYLKEDVIKFDSSFSFNSAFILKSLAICDFAEGMEMLIKNMYLDKQGKLKNILPEYEFKSFVYSLTHIIIAASGFYDKFVNNHDWIITFFFNNMDELIKKMTLDVKAEIGLCIKLCRKENANKNKYETLLSDLNKSFERENLEDANFIVKKEHTNSILMMLFSNTKTFYLGPDLSNYKY